MSLTSRVVLPPLTRLRADGHTPTPLMAEYYEQRSREPGTLLVTEGTFIHGAAGGFPGVPGVWSQEQIAGWKNVFDKIHANKSFAFVQLWALGRQAYPNVLEAEGFDYTAPSPVAIGRVVNPDGDLAPQRAAPRELTIDEIKQFVQYYVQAAKNAIAAGADGVEIHSANGYLLDQFLHPNTNTRTDQYGGSIINRARLPLEVIDAVVDAVGHERVGVRISPWGAFGDMDVPISPIPQWSYFVAEIERRALEGKRLAYVSSLEARALQDEAVFPKIMPKDINSLSDFIGHIWTGPWIRSGQMAQDLAVADKDDRTLLAIGREFIANPDLVSRLRDGAELNPWNRSTFYWGNDPSFDKAIGYTDYPARN